MPGLLKENDIGEDRSTERLFHQEHVVEIHESLDMPVDHRTRQQNNIIPIPFQGPTPATIRARSEGFDPTRVSNELSETTRQTLSNGASRRSLANDDQPFLASGRTLATGNERIYYNQHEDGKIASSSEILTETTRQDLSNEASRRSLAPGEEPPCCYSLDRERTASSSDEFNDSDHQCTLIHDIDGQHGVPAYRRLSLPLDNLVTRLENNNSSTYNELSGPLGRQIDISQADASVDDSTTNPSHPPNQDEKEVHEVEKTTNHRSSKDKKHSPSKSKHSPTKSKHSPSKSKHSPSKRQPKQEALIHAAAATASAIIPPTSASPSQNNDLPTDFSGSSGSECNNSKVPVSGTETVVCPEISSLHQGKEVFNKLYTLPIDTVFTLLFTSSKFMLDLHTARKTYDVVASPWQSNPNNNKKLRQVTYTLTLPTNSFGPKVSHVTETQVMSEFSKPGEIYTVDAEACNAGIPYADTFFVSNHWCLTRESPTETRICVWSNVKYKKNVWGFMKNVIDKNSFSGVESLMNDINTSLMIEVERANLKRSKRRRRRAGSKTADISDVHTIIPDNIQEIHKSTQFPIKKISSPSFSQEIPKSNVDVPVRWVAVILFLLLMINGLLYYKLWALEDKVLQPVPLSAIDPNLLRSAMDEGGGGSTEEWVRILQQQEALHTNEVERWRKAIGEVAQFLKKAEESLRTLHTSIPTQHASKLQILLHQIQSLHRKHPPPQETNDEL